MSRARGAPVGAIVRSAMAAGSKWPIVGLCRVTSLLGDAWSWVDGNPARFAAREIEDGQVTPADSDELSVSAEQVPRLIPGGIRNNLKNVSRAECKLQVQSALPQLHRLHGYLRKPAIDFGLRVHGGRKAKLLTVIVTCESYAPRFDKPPKTRNHKTHVIVEGNHPLVITPRE